MKTVFSGIQPTNNLHLGNYLGAIKNWVELQKDYRCFYCVVDLHAITVPQDPKELTANTINAAKTYIALGVDPAKSTIFVQSQVKEHAELTWVLNTITKVAELERMTQFKEKAYQQPGSPTMGLFDYPVLMAADIILYDPDLVPVGEDQTQHVELARDIAKRFNQTFGQTFTVPEALIKKDGARVMGLDDPKNKMSKSASSANNYISLLDKPEAAKKKIMKAVTDSGNEVKGGANKPALNNLLGIYSLLSGKAVKEIEADYADRGYGDFKAGLAEVVAEFLTDFQNKFNEISDSEVTKILAAGADKARGIAEKKMVAVKDKLGLLK